MKNFSLIIITFLLAGCVSRYAENQCKDAGYSPGTTEYNICFNRVVANQQRCLMAYSQGLSQPTLGGSSLVAQSNGAAAMQQMGCQ